MQTSSTTSELEARIAAERDRLAAEERNEVTLTESRLAPLEAGDDAALDKVERKIDDSRSQQLRIQERIELLEKRLIASKDADKVAEEERRAACCAKARDMLPSALAEYKKLAEKAAAALRRIAVIDQAIVKLGGFAHEGSIGLRSEPNTKIPEKIVEEQVRVDSQVTFGAGHNGGSRQELTSPVTVGGKTETRRRVEPARTIIGQRYPAITEVALIPGIDWKRPTIYSSGVKPDPVAVAALIEEVSK